MTPVIKSINLRIAALLFFCSLVFIPSTVFTQTVFNTNCREALYEILQFNHAKAIEIVRLEKKTNPHNLYLPYLENYSAFLNVLFGESPEDWEKYKQNNAACIKTLSQPNENNKYRLLLLSEVNLQTSILYAKFNEKLKALKYLYSSQKIITECRNRIPDLPQINKQLSVIILVNSYLPQMVKNFVPINLTVGDAFVLLEKYRNQVIADSVLFLESNILASYLKYQFADNAKEAYSYIKSIVNNSNPNPLLNMAVSLGAMRHGKSNEALWYLLESKVETKSLLPDFFTYLLGEVKLNTQLNGLNEFNDFLDKYKGKSYRKSAWIKMGWNYLLLGDSLNYQRCRLNVLQGGAAANDADASAMLYAQAKGYPNVHLLKARLLFDGGLYNKSRAILLEEKTRLSLTSRHDKTEYMYRFARINQEEGDIAAAKNYYLHVLKVGKDEPFYFAANSALQLGLIFEKEKNYPLAKTYFTQSISLNKYGYTTSIGAKAKKGINRVTQSQ